jgi:cob(I)alamin adenosyltransferase
MGPIYTRTGDGGETSLGNGNRVSKSGPRVDLYGEVDELNSVLGCCVAVLRREAGEAGRTLVEQIEAIQSRLFDLGTVLADPVRSQEAVNDPDALDFGSAMLEGHIDGHDESLAPLRNFILPGGAEASAHLHLARSVCRRCERKAVALAVAAPVPRAVIVFLNRLSDYLFTAARAANAATGRADVIWRPAGD